MRAWAIWICLVAAAAGLRAAEWIETKSGPFVVYSDAGEERAREALYELEQFRFLFGEALGKKDLETVWPVMVVVRRAQKGAPRPRLGFGRDGWMAEWPAGTAAGPEFLRELALLLIEDNWRDRMPGRLEETVAALFSTMTVDKGRVTLGAPPAPEQRTKEWALLAWLLTDETTATRTRVLLGNLAAGADWGTAFRNAFGSRGEEFERAAEQYLAGGQFRTVTMPARPLNPRLAFPVVPMLPSRLRVLGADLLMARGAPAAEVRVAYQRAIEERPGPLAWEGLGLALLQEGAKEEARQAFEAMKKLMDPQRDKCARGLLELGLYEEAAQKNPKWAEPYVRAAAREAGPVRRAYLLKKAAELRPRDAELWQQLAKAQTEAKQYAEAEKSWRAAERAARTEEERARIARAREEFEQARFEAEAAERARRRKEEQDELERLKQEALERIREAEKKANQGGVEGKKIEPWWEGPPTQTLAGVLENVQCQGRRARLVVRDAAGKAVTLEIADPGKVVVLGAGGQQAQLSCGVQKPARRVKVEYTAAAAGKAGEVVSVEFLP
jgi:tetratricopeptide (TPR) repeat protein